VKLYKYYKCGLIVYLSKPIFYNVDLLKTQLVSYSIWLLNYKLFVTFQGPSIELILLMRSWIRAPLGVKGKIPD